MEAPEAGHHDSLLTVLFRMHKKFNRYRSRFRVKQKKRFKALKFATRHPFAVPIITFIVLAGLTVGSFLLLNHSHSIAPKDDSRIVIVSYDHHVQTVPSHVQTVGALLQKLHITVNQGDVVEPAQSTMIYQDDFRVNIYRAVPVEVVDGGHTTFTFSAATTPRSIASQAGITAYPDDDLTTQPVSNFVEQHAVGEQVVIDRATPITMNLYGTPLTLRTHAKTVGELIADKKIKIANGDTVLPTPDTPITPNQQVFIVRNGTHIATETQSIPAPQQIIDDDSLAYGTSAIRQQGTAGQQVVTYQVNLQNGVEVSRSLIQTVVTQSPVPMIVVRGTSLSGIKGDMALAGISASDYTYADYIISHESGWCPTKAQGEHDCPVIPDNSMTSAGYGLCQATPGYKMASAGSDWATNPVTQLKWCAGYAQAHYGGWAAAYNHWVAYTWW